jgi:HSP20 family molecular chaperone IbpA
MAAETTVPAVQNEDSSREDTRSNEVYILPPVDIYEDEEGLVVLADLPGVDIADLDVRIERNVLTIQAKAHHLAPGEPIYREFQISGFFRQFRISDEIDEERVDAAIHNGVLRLSLKRAASTQPRHIEVRAA